MSNEVWPITKRLKHRWQMRIMHFACVEHGGIVDKIGGWRKAPWSRWPRSGLTLCKRWPASHDTFHLCYHAHSAFHVYASFNIINISLRTATYMLVRLHHSSSKLVMISET
jgi:hypothetical protein